MFIGRVIGTVVAPQKHPAYDGQKILLVKPLDLDGAPRAKSPAVVAVDRAQAGTGDTVLVMEEGSSARLMLANESAPVISVVVGFVDAVERAGAGPGEASR